MKENRSAPLGILTATPVVVAMLREREPVAPLDAFRQAVNAIYYTRKVVLGIPAERTLLHIDDH